MTIISYHNSFNPNWTCRPTVCEPDSLPNAAFPNVSPGLSAAGSVKFGVLVRLKASPRNWSLAFSVTSNSLNSEKSRFFEPGPRKADAVPTYELAFRFYENGVSTKLYIDYGDFAIRGELKELTFLEETPCSPQPDRP